MIDPGDTMAGISLTWDHGKVSLDLSMELVLGLSEKDFRLLWLSSITGNTAPLDHLRPEIPPEPDNISHGESPGDRYRAVQAADGVLGCDGEPGCDPDCRRCFPPLGEVSSCMTGSCGLCTACTESAKDAAYLAGWDDGIVAERGQIFGLIEEGARETPEWLAHQLRNTLKWLRMKAAEDRPLPVDSSPGANDGIYPHPESHEAR